MISLVLYGRNDSYGYNLHKRAALSLNCMAEVLTDPSDEILFVDYNTPDDFPTFPEAIQDTLTKRARGLLRILRVRPCIHERFKSRTHLVALEPVARNVAIRRSDPSNRWILSTNTDMIFVPRGDSSLSEITADLAPGFYHAPRIEIPEVLWESFDRGAPAEIINTVREWGTALHLNEIILGAKFILYDGPGDFQLLLRSDLFENEGFHEGMLLGWHVDSNIAKRMYIKYGMVGDLGNQVYGYHCDHTRQVTPAHSHTRLQNDWRTFCDEVERPDIPELAETWGCVNDTIEELRLVAEPASVYVRGLRDAIGQPLVEAPVVNYIIETYNKVSYDPRHVLPFLADMFVSMARNANLGWYGAGLEMLSRFAALWEKLGFIGKILVDRDLIRRNDSAGTVRYVSSAEILDGADAFVFDFGDLPGSPHHTRATARKQLSNELLRRFCCVVRAERCRLSEGSGMPSRRIIALNAINNHYEKVVSALVAAAATPCATHMRHGYVLPAKAKYDWLPLLVIGQAGIRVGDQIKTNATRLGLIIHGPYKYLDEGRYRLSITIELSAEDRHRTGNEPCIAVEARVGTDLLSAFLIKREALRNPDHELFFVVSSLAAEALDLVDIRLKLLVPVSLSIRSVTVEAAPAITERDSDTATDLMPLPLQIEDWLPYLSIGSLGHIERAGVAARQGSSDYVVFGPYWPLPAGQYEMTAKIEATSDSFNNGNLITADVTTTSGDCLVSAKLSLGMLGRDYNERQCLLRLPFDVPSRNFDNQVIETRIWSSGNAQFKFRSLSVTPTGERNQKHLYPFLSIDEASSWVAGDFRDFDKHAGFVSYSIAKELEPGCYRLAFQVAIGPSDKVTLRKEQPRIIALAKHRFEVLTFTAMTCETDQEAEHQLLFEVPSVSESGVIEFLFQAVAVGSLSLRRLALERTATAIRSSGAAVCRLENWLPFLRLRPRAHTDPDGIVVSKGPDDFAVYGPFWTLPPGRYNMIASIVPEPASRADNPIITGQVVADEGSLMFATGTWRLGQFQCDNKDDAIEMRVPFSLSDELLPESRTIETRIYSPSNASFRLRSLAVRIRSDELEHDWFPYLTIGDYGIHTGREIKAVQNKFGLIASTPPMAVAPGHYKLLPQIYTADANASRGDCIALELWSGSELIAIETRTPENGQPLQFNATDDIAKRGVEVRIRAMAPSVVSIVGLVVERTSNAVAPNPVPTVWRLSDWRPFLQTSPRVHPDQNDLAVSEGRDEFVVCGPHWTLPAGHYEMIASIVPHLSNRDNKPIVTGQVTGVSGKRIFAAAEWRLGQIRYGDRPRAVEIRVPFTLPDDLPAESRAIETRIFSPGNASFLIRSVAVKRRRRAAFRPLIVKRLRPLKSLLKLWRQ